MATREISLLIFFIDKTFYYLVGVFQIGRYVLPIKQLNKIKSDERKTRSKDNEGILVQNILIRGKLYKELWLIIVPFCVYY